MNADVGKETLGMFLAPGGSMKEQTKDMKKKKINPWISCVRSGNIPGKDAFNAIITTLIKSLKYPIRDTILSRKDCNKLVKPIHDAALPKARICRTIPQDIKYGSKDALGLRLDDLYIAQGIDKVIFYLEESNGNSMSRPLLQANIEWAVIGNVIPMISSFFAEVHII